jgi:hypothetical protein
MRDAFHVRVAGGENYGYCVPRLVQRAFEILENEALTPLYGIDLGFGRTLRGPAVCLLPEIHVPSTQRAR